MFEPVKHRETKKWWIRKKKWTGKSNQKIKHSQHN